MVMKSRYPFSVTASVLLMSALMSAPLARAQRAGRVAVRAPAVSLRHPSSAFATSPLRTGRHGSNGFFGAPFAGTNLFPGGAVGVNGINAVITPGNLGVEAAIDPATQWNLALATRVLKNNSGIFPGGGFYLLSGGGVYAIPEESGDYAESAPPAPQQQPQVIVVQQAPVGQQSAVQSAEQPVAPPLPDSGQFTLVMRDGKQVEAVAFTHMKDKIVYITVDGSRRTIALNDLDADATIRVNQERGTPLQLPL
jgi:hypothetical protein